MENPMIKKAADELLRLADEIEKEASEKIFFACNSCDHKVNLATINAKRKEAADLNSKQAGKQIVIASISVDDKIHCPNCTSGKMAYAPTEESEKYLVEADDSKKEPEEYDSMKEEKEEKEEKESSKKEEAEATKKDEVESAKKDEKEDTVEEEKEEDKDPVMKKASELGLDLEAVARYSDV